MFPPHRKNSSALLPVLAAIVMAGFARADITVLHHWKLAEDDAATAPITKDSVGTLDLNLTGTYARVASTVPGSTLGMQFTNTWGAYPFEAQSYATNTDTLLVLDDPSNWGFECWVNMASIPGAGVDSETTFVHIGSHSAGSEIMQILQGRYQIHLPGVSLADSGMAAADDLGKWMHFAMVNQQEYTVDDTQNPPVITPTGVNRVRLYRNGAEIAAVNGTANGGTRFVTIGSQKLNGTGGLQYSRGLNGIIDDVRIFTFALGKFNPATDLLYPNGPASTLPFIVTDLSIGANGDVTLKWNSQAGKTYSVWESADLNVWLENDDSIPSGGQETTATVTPLNVASKRLFFRVQSH